MAEKPKATIIEIGLGKPKSGAASAPPKLGPGRPGKSVPPPPKTGQPRSEPEMAEEPMPMGGGVGSGFACPNCGCPLKVDLDPQEYGGEPMGPEAA